MNQPIKILYISHSHPPEESPLDSIGGMQNVSVQLINTLNKRVDVELKTILQKTSWSWIGFKTFFFLISLLWRIPGKSKKFGPDVVLFSSMVTAAVLPLLLKKLDVPCVTINHGQDVTLPVKPYQLYLPRVFKQLQGVISVSSATRQASIERGMNPEKGVVLPNGFISSSNGRAFDKESARDLLEARLDLNIGDRYLLLSVGRQVKRKGHQWFIENVIHKIESKIVLLLIGDGPETESIREARDAHKQKEHIVIAGRQPDQILRAAYAASDLFVMPNIPVEGDMEGFGIVLLEANSAGLPAVASNLEGIKDVIAQGVNGYRVPPENAEQFAKKIDEVLQNELPVMSQSCSTFVEEKFSWDFVISQYLDFLSRVANEH